MRLSVAGLLGATLLSAGLAAQAAAAPAVSSPAKVPGLQSAGINPELRAAFAGQGAGIAVMAGDTGVRGAVLQGGRFSGAARLGRARIKPGMLEVVASPSRRVAVWQELPGVLRSAWWSSATKRWTIRPLASSPGYDPTLGTSAGGESIVAYWSGGSLWSQRLPATSATGWTAPQAIATVATTRPQPALSVAPDGSALVTWVDLRNGQEILRAARRGVSGDFGAAFDLFPTPGAAVPRSLWTGGSTFLGGFQTNAGAGQVAAVDASTVQQPLAVVPPTGSPAVTPQAGRAGGGDTLAWSAGGGMIRLGTRAPGASSYTVSSVNRVVGGVSEPSLFAGPATQRTLVAWQVSSGGQFRTLVRARSGTRWSAVQTVASRSNQSVRGLSGFVGRLDTQVGLDATGRAWLVWNDCRRPSARAGVTCSAYVASRR